MEARPYANAITELVKSVAARMEKPAHPLLARAPEQRALLVIVTGDRGLAGAFNSNTVRRAMEFLSRTRRKEAGSVCPLDERGAMRSGVWQKWPVLGEYVGITSRAEFTKAQEIASKSSRSTRRQNRCGVLAVPGIQKRDHAENGFREIAAD